jgi:hypothetical protein
MLALPGLGRASPLVADCALPSARQRDMLMAVSVP